MPATSIDTEQRVAALSISGLSQTFPGVKALDDVDLVVRAGSVHALLGHNGSGKSTLVKALAGYQRPDEGCDARVDGVSLELGSASDAKRLGVRFVHQDLGIVPELSAQDNIGLVRGYERGPAGTIRWREQRRLTVDLLARFGIDIDPRTPLAQATPVERTAVAIVRAVAGWEQSGGLLVLDEPTASLPAREVDELFRLVREIRDSGTAVLLISHRLDEVMAIADHATVLRNGVVVWDGSTEGRTVRDFARVIANVEGTELLEQAPPRAAASAPGATPVLEVTSLAGRYLRDVSLQVAPGEIVGVAGLLGSGREELPYVVAGAGTFPSTGRIAIGGKVVGRPSIRTMRESGVALVPADRAVEGIVAEFSVGENVSIAALPSLRGHSARGRGVSRAQERSFVRRWLGSVSADTSSARRPITTLSGGNQQKAVIARWLSVGPKILVVSEPTAGIDIGARTQIYREMRQRADAGLALLVCSSDAEDLVAACDRVIVLRDGLVAAELHGIEISKATIVAAMEGAHE